MPGSSATRSLGGVIPATRSAAVAAELKRMILSGELPSGAKLRQVEISQRFGVSTTPVREAFTALAREGLVEQDAHRGVKVILPSQDDLRENYEIRMALEPLAAERAARAIGAEELDLLREQIDRMESIPVKGLTPAQETERENANREFHRIIYVAAERPRLAALIWQLRASAGVFSRLSTTDPPAAYRTQAAREHRAIFDALAAGKAKPAGREMKKHLEHNLEYISQALEGLAAATEGSDSD